MTTRPLPIVDVRTLAMLLSAAARIEPELIRAVRLAVAPAINVGAEAELWFSDLVATRSFRVVTLDPQVVPELRNELAGYLRRCGADHPVHTVGAIMDRVHRTATPALRVEERATWLAISGMHAEPDLTRAAIEETLRPALHALVDEARFGIATWFAGAWHRLPKDVRATITAWQLAQVTTPWIAEQNTFTAAVTPKGLSLSDVTEIAPAIGDVEIGVRRDGPLLVLGEPPRSRRTAIDVPDTRPRLLEVVPFGDGPAHSIPVTIEPGAVARVMVGAAGVRIHNGRGAVYELAPVRAPLWRRLAAGTVPRRPRGRPLDPALQDLIDILRRVRDVPDVAPLERAYRTAREIHDGQRRRNGDPYIAHSVAVATILAEVGLDLTTLVAGLLHGSLDHTDYPLDQLRRDFGDEVAQLVDGVSRIAGTESGTSDNVRKLLVATGRDPRVLVIKLADRLHNMRTLASLPPETQERKAKETLEIMAPLAHRLGMNTIKWELEDLAFGTLFPRRYEEIRRLIDEHTPQREELLRQIVREVTAHLRSARVTAGVSGRPKHLYSVYQKMIVSGREFADIHDLVGVRILVDTVRDCYAALRVVHANWLPVPGRFKDYIAMPKFNLYQALHTTVVGSTGRPVEVQIRTYAMHRTAEYGIAAHWRYKETRNAATTGPAAHIDDITWLRHLLDWQREAADPDEFLDALRFDLASQQVYVFTPKGDMVTLPSGSTTLDFAYAVHTEVGHRCIGAKVNGKLVPLSSPLSGGDVIEIFTSRSDTAGPTRDWLGLVRSPRARTKIRRYFARERREEAAEPGGHASQRPVIPASPPRERGSGHFPGVTVTGYDDVNVRLARCCTPVPNDAIFGFMKNDWVSVHRSACANAPDLKAQPDRIVDVSWNLSSASTFLVSIHVEALDGTRLLADITNTLSEEGVNILTATMTTTRDRVAVIRFSFEIADPQRLQHLLSAVRRVDGVYDAYRVTSGN